MNAAVASDSLDVAIGEQGPDTDPTMMASTPSIVSLTRTMPGTTPTTMGRRRRRRRRRRRDGVPQDSFLFVLSVGV